MFERYGPKYRIYVTLTVLLGLIALGMSITIVNVAIPYIQGAFGMSASQVQWLATGFLAATAIALLTTPWLIRAFGQRNTYVGLLVVFIAGSLAGGFATGMVAIIVARVVQGATTGVIRPVALEALFTIFPPNRRGMAMALYGMCMALPLTLATVLGGYLVEAFNWRYVFFVAIPICVAAIVMGWFFLPEREESGRRPPFDWVGTLAAFVAIFTILGALSNGQRWGWSSNAVLGLVAISVATFAFFLWWESRQEHPLLDLEIFKFKGFVAGCLLLMLFGAMFYGVMYLLPLFVQQILHYSPVTVGLIFVPSTLVLAILVPVVGILSDRLRPYWLILPGMTIAFYALLRFSAVDWNTSFQSLAVSMGLLCVGMACVPPPVFARAINSLPQRLLGFGSGTVNLALQLGGAFSTPFIVTMLGRRTVFHGAHLTDGLNPGNEMARQTLHQLSEAAERAGVSETYQGAVARYLLGAIDRTWATIYAYQDCFLLVASAFVIMLVPAFMLFRWGRETSPDPGGH